jgi:hypothetical protein
MAQKLTDAYISGLNEVLRSFKALPKEAAKELRDSSVVIAERYMAPSWKNAAMGAGPWGQKIAHSVKVRRDRLPSVQIGGNKKVFSGGASATMVRYPSDQGRGTARPGRVMPPAFEKTDWIKEAKRGYATEAVIEWTKAVDRIVLKWTAM